MFGFMTVMNGCLYSWTEYRSDKADHIVIEVRIKGWLCCEVYIDDTFHDLHLSLWFLSCNM